jgi:molecular chaperone GrpE
MDSEMVDVPEDANVDAAHTASNNESDATADTPTLEDVDVVALLTERDDLKDIAIRLQADFENYKKRVASTQADEIDRATGRFVETLLPVLDACEAAVAHGSDDVLTIWSTLIGGLQKQGLEALDLVNKAFDPSLADAVMHEDAGGAEPMVSEVLRTGYLWKGKVLRPAMVKVKG